MQSDQYRRAQLAVAELKSAVVSLLEEHGSGMTNAVVGRSLGIYGGHKGHEGHISRTLLAMLETEGLVQQNDADQSWTIRTHVAR
jgi:DNA-binding IclR family transcriptional regulator